MLIKTLNKPGPNDLLLCTPRIQLRMEFFLGLPFFADVFTETYFIVFYDNSQIANSQPKIHVDFDPSNFFLHTSLQPSGFLLLLTKAINSLSSA